MEKPSVQVQYHDPQGIYPLIERSFTSQFPLHDLHWDSTTRQSRSISLLNVELHTDNGAEQFAASEEPSDAERRHQIPGLRQKPYLNICFIEGEDIETYKASTRNDIREWLKIPVGAAKNAASTLSTDQLDACAWLILHVTFLNEQGIGLQRSNSLSKPSLDATKKTIGARWSSRSSKSVFEKLKSDFNTVSKQDVVHVFQISVQHQEQDELGKFSLKSSSEKSETDLAFELKYLILSSLERRVKRYEDDIAEKEQQQKLPGWNFNTFFVLKEGLARGFESIGLWEDALVGYKELAGSLDLTIRDYYLKSSDSDYAGHFLEHSKVLHDVFTYALRSLSNANHKLLSGETSDKLQFPDILDVDRTSFRALILANEISAFDFRNYTFARIVSLYLLHAGASSGRSIKAALGGAEDDESKRQEVLGELCHFAKSYISESGWYIRQELSCSHIPDIAGNRVAIVTQNIAASWTFSACCAILHKVPLTPSCMNIKHKLSEMKTIPASQSALKRQVLGLSSEIHDEKYPKRASSLSADYSSSTSTLPNSRSETLHQTEPDTKTVSYLAEHVYVLARADLLLLKRRTACGIHAMQNHLRRDFRAFHGHVLRTSVLDDISLDSSSDQTTAEPSSTEISRVLYLSSGLFSAELTSILASQAVLDCMYKDSTKEALACYIYTNQDRMTETMLADLAVLAYNHEEWSLAIAHFQCLSDSLQSGGYLLHNAKLFALWALCYLNEGDLRKYLDMALAAISRPKISNVVSEASFQDLGDLIALSAKLDDPISISPDGIFTCTVSDMQHIVPVASCGFNLQLRIGSTIREKLRIDNIQLRISATSHGCSSDIYLNSGTTELTYGSNHVILSSCALTPGLFHIESYSLISNKICFVKDVSSASSPVKPHASPSELSLGARRFAERQMIRIWPATDGVRLLLSQHPLCNLGKKRSVLVTIESGKNSMLAGQVSLLPRTAGVRLHTSEMESAQQGRNGLKVLEAGGISFKAIQAESTLQLCIPYTLETTVESIVVHGTMEYRSDGGRYSHSMIISIPITIPLEVNIQTTFKQTALYLHLNIGTAKSSPVTIKDVVLNNADGFHTELPKSDGSDVEIYGDHSYSTVAKLRGISSTEHRATALEGRKPCIEISYRSLVDLVVGITRECLRRYLYDHDLRNFTYLLLDRIDNVVLTKLTPQVLTSISMMRRYRLLSYDEHGWEELLLWLPNASQTKLRHCLHDWHNASTHINVDDKEGDMCPIHQLVVPIDVPQTEMLHIVSLRPRGIFKDNESLWPVSTVGQALQLDLNIKQIRHWGSAGALDDEVEFSYDLQASYGTWLIGGQQSSFFTLKDGQSAVFKVILIPQRCGHLMLPGIVIKAVSERRQVTTKTTKAFTERTIACDVDNLDQGQSILVLPDSSFDTKQPGGIKDIRPFLPVQATAQV